MQFDHSPLDDKDKKDDLSSLLSKAKEVLSVPPPSSARPRPYARKENADILLALMAQVDKTGVTLTLKREKEEGEKEDEETSSSTSTTSASWTSPTMKAWVCQVMALIRETPIEEAPSIQHLLASTSVTYQENLETIVIKKK